MNWTKRILGALAFASLPFSAAALTWNIQDVVFADGATVTGSFDYDAATNTYSSIDILYSPGPFRMESLIIGASLFAAFSETVQSTKVGAINEIHLHFATPLDDVGGKVALREVLRFSCVDVHQDGTCLNVASSTSGDYLSGIGYVQSSDATVVPLPASIWLLGAALAGLGLRRRVTG